MESQPTYSTPAIVLSTSDEVASEATELIPSQTYAHPVHGGQKHSKAKERYTSLGTGLTAGGSVDREPHGILGTTILGARGSRRVSIYPSIRPIQESVEEGKDDAEVETTLVQVSAGSVAMEQPFTANPSTTAEAQVPKILINTSSDNVPQHQPLRMSVRKRAQSFPAEAPANALPLLELPSQPAEPTVLEEEESEEVETSLMEQNSGVQKSQTKMGKFAQMAIMAKKWKKRSLDAEEISQQQQSEKETIATRQKLRPLIEVPRTLKLDLLDEAYPIVQKTYQMYMSELGPKHKLTESAKDHLQRLATQLGRQNT